MSIIGLGFIWDSLHDCWMKYGQNKKGRDDEGGIRSSGTERGPDDFIDGSWTGGTKMRSGKRFDMGMFRGFP